MSPTSSSTRAVTDATAPGSVPELGGTAKATKRPLADAIVRPTTGGVVGVGGNGVAVGGGAIRTSMLRAGAMTKGSYCHATRPTAASEASTNNRLRNLRKRAALGPPGRKVGGSIKRSHHPQGLVTLGCRADANGVPAKVEGTRTTRPKGDTGPTAAVSVRDGSCRGSTGSVSDLRRLRRLPSDPSGDIREPALSSSPVSCRALASRSSASPVPIIL